MTDREKALACLDGLHPSALTYQQWLDVGFALQHSGCSASDWEHWSGQDREKFKPGECARKWNGFHNSGGKPVTLGTLIELTRQYGELPRGLWDDQQGGQGFGWDDFLPTIHNGRDLDPRWVQGDAIPAPSEDWKPMDFARYLEAMFQPEERVGLCVDTWPVEDKDGGKTWKPRSGVWDRTAGQLIELCHQCDGDLSSVIGDTNAEAGAWVVINPLLGTGRQDKDVAVHRHTLLESDDDDLEKQLAIIREMKLPVSAIVHSGGKSIHALVRVDAPDFQEYRKRVDYLYKTAERYGLKVDEANRNPSRLSRLPGVLRNGKPQYMIAGREGCPDWSAWVNYVEDLKDDLPDPVTLDYDTLPEMAPELIRGVLRQGRKLLITGPSKAGKTMNLIGLCAAIVNGGAWMGWQCEQGKVLYLNLELPADTCAHRFKKVYDAMGGDPARYRDLHVWNLRGQSCPLDKLAPKLIRRCDGKGFVAIVVDPIYKVSTGDENDAADMSAFCNQLDKIALKLGCSVIYCHHHSKGSQGHKKAMDRASGSGVLARDVDALVDLIELEISKERREAIVDKIACSMLSSYIESEHGHNPIEDDARAPVDAYLLAAQQAFKRDAERIASVVCDARQRAAAMSGWRVEATLREFAWQAPRRVWFDFPVHRPDEWDLLTDAKAAGEEPAWKADRKQRDEAVKEKADALRNETVAAVEACGGVGEATVEDVAQELGITERACRTRLTKSGKYRYADGIVEARKERRK